MKITSWWPRAGDIIPKEAGKGTSVKKMLEYFGYTKEEALNSNLVTESSKYLIKELSNYLDKN